MHKSDICRPSFEREKLRFHKQMYDDFRKLAIIGIVAYGMYKYIQISRHPANNKDNKK